MTTTLVEAQDMLKTRIGEHTGRVATLKDILELRGQEVWIVTCPIDRENDEQPKYIGTSFISPWTVGELINETGKEITSPRNLPKKNVPTERYFIFHETKTYEKEDKILRVLLNLKDYNVIPNDNTSNHAVFLTEDDASKYRMWLRMKWPIHEALEKLDPRCVNAREVEYDDVKANGITYTKLP